MVSPRGTVLAASSGDRRLFRGGRGVLYSYILYTLVAGVIPFD